MAPRDLETGLRWGAQRPVGSSVLRAADTLLSALKVADAVFAYLGSRLSADTSANRLFKMGPLRCRAHQPCQSGNVCVIMLARA